MKDTSTQNNVAITAVISIAPAQSTTEKRVSSQTLATPAEAQFVLAVMAQKSPIDLSIQELMQRGVAVSAFDSMLATARARGFKDQRRLVAAARRGKATPGAIRHAEAACALLEVHEMAFAFARAAACDHFIRTKQLAPGWKLAPTAFAMATGGTHA